MPIHWGNREKPRKLESWKNRAYSPEGKVAARWKKRQATGAGISRAALWTSLLSSEVFSVRREIRIVSEGQKATATERIASGESIVWDMWDLTVKTGRRLNKRSERGEAVRKGTLTKKITKGRRCLLCQDWTAQDPGVKAP
jgi:hypothetical protein